MLSILNCHIVTLFMLFSYDKLLTATLREMVHTIDHPSSENKYKIKAFVAIVCSSKHDHTSIVTSSRDSISLRNLRKFLCSE